MQRLRAVFFVTLLGACTIGGRSPEDKAGLPGEEDAGGGGAVEDPTPVVGCIPQAANLDMDRNAELVLWAANPQQWLVDGVAVAGPIDGVVGAPAAADYSGDGITDLAFFTGGVFHIDQLGSASLGPAGAVPVAADYDGDGSDNLAVYDPQTGVWTIGGLGAVNFPGAPGAMPAPSDYDGNGVADLAFFDPATGVWTVAGRDPIGPFGGANQVPVPADWNGDGVPEIAVYDRDSGEVRAPTLNLPLGPFRCPGL